MVDFVLNLRMETSIEKSTSSITLGLTSPTYALN